MKRIYLILILGIFMIGTITAIGFNLSPKEFTNKITVLSSDLFYDKLLDLEKLDTKSVPLNTNVSVENSGLDISQNKEGVLRVRAE